MIQKGKTHIFTRFTTEGEEALARVINSTSASSTSTSMALKKSTNRFNIKNGYIIDRLRFCFQRNIICSLQIKGVRNRKLTGGKQSILSALVSMFSLKIISELNVVSNIWFRGHPLFGVSQYLWISAYFR